MKSERLKRIEEQAQEIAKRRNPAPYATVTLADGSKKSLLWVDALILCTSGKAKEVTSDHADTETLLKALMVK